MSHALNRGHIVRAYDRDLQNLRALVTKIGDLVLVQVQDALRALIQGDMALAQQVLGRERRIDELNLEADEEVFTVIAKRQPQASDLRLILAVSKAIGDLERAGDKAVRIASMTLRMIESEADGQVLPLEPALAEGLLTLNHLACCMLERALEGLTEVDLHKAVSVFEDQDRLHRTYKSVSGQMSESTGLVGGRPLASLLTIAHAIERIGNHGGNIAEQVVYMITGDDVRYRNRDLLVDALKESAGRMSD